MKHAKHPAGFSMQSLPTSDFQAQWEHQKGNLDGLLNFFGWRTLGSLDCPLQEISPKVISHEKSIRRNGN